MLFFKKEPRKISVSAPEKELLKKVGQFQQKLKAEFMGMTQ